MIGIVICLVGLFFMALPFAPNLRMSWESRRSLHRPEPGKYKVTRTGRVCLFLAGVVILVRGVLMIASTR